MACVMKKQLHFGNCSKRHESGEKYWISSEGKLKTEKGSLPAAFFCLVGPTGFVPKLRDSDP